MELETMRIKHGVCGREHSPSRLDAFVKSLEEERDYYRLEAERYKITRGAGGPGLSPSPDRGRSPKSKGIMVEDPNDTIKMRFYKSFHHDNNSVFLG